MQGSLRRGSCTSDWRPVLCNDRANLPGEKQPGPWKYVVEKEAQGGAGLE